MPKNKAIPHLIAYDIGNEKRLAKIHRFLKNRAIPLQYSVFFIQLNATQRKKIIEELDSMIVDAEDDIRIYPLPNEPEWASLGKTLWPESIFGLQGLPKTD